MRGRQNRKFGDADFSERAKERRAERNAATALKQSKKMDIQDWDDIDTVPESHRKAKR
jgi:hypothetical protein